MFPCCCHTDNSSGSSAESAACVVCHGGTTPARYQVDIAGMRDVLAVFCDICEQLDGSYIVHPVGSCWYAVEFPPVCEFFRLELLVAPGAYYVTFIKPGPGPGSMGYFRLGMAFPRDCRETALPLTPGGGPMPCDHYSSTCRITAL